MISTSYLQSKFCLAEAGAALARKTAGSANFYSLVVPPVAYSDIEGVLFGRQVGRISDRSALSELHQIVPPAIRDLVPLPVWEQKRDAFLKVCSQEVGQEEARELSQRITLQSAIGAIVSHLDCHRTISYRRAHSAPTRITNPLLSGYED